MLDGAAKGQFVGIVQFRTDAYSTGYHRHLDGEFFQAAEYVETGSVPFHRGAEGQYHFLQILLLHTSYQRINLDILGADPLDRGNQTSEYVV